MKLKIEFHNNFKAGLMPFGLNFYLYRGKSFKGVLPLISFQINVLVFSIYLVVTRNKQ